MAFIHSDILTWYFEFYSAGLNTYLSLANLLQEHYPGIVKKLIVINGEYFLVALI